MFSTFQLNASLSSNSIHIMTPHEKEIHFATPKEVREHAKAFGVSLL
jgi:hypothetical protein